jgi:peptidoglycan/xylan/chitin deacetylase (PgdA/CDA1 family)
MPTKGTVLYISVIIFLLLAFISSLVISSVSAESAKKELSDLKVEMKALEVKFQSAQRDARSADKARDAERAAQNTKIAELESALLLAQSDAQAQKARADEFELALKNTQKLKTAYLTFDDGPSPNTLNILKILKEQNVPATFFVVGTKYPQYMKNIVNDGHAIGLHTYSHIYSSVYASVNAFFDDQNKIAEVVKAQTGLTPRIIRFAGGSSNMESKKYSKGIMTTLTKEVKKRNMRYFDWNCDSGDASGTNVPAAKLVQNVVNGAKSKDSVCVLMHDTNAKQTTAEALPEIIKQLKAQGYQFASLNVTSPVFEHGVNN